MNEVTNIMTVQLTAILKGSNEEVTAEIKAGQDSDRRREL